MPRVFLDYIESGSWGEVTCRANRRDLDEVVLRQRVGIDVSNRTLESTLVGEPASMPVAIAPTGLAGMVHPDGEIHLARAAERAGVPFTLSTMSVCSIEDVAERTERPFWFQLYLMRDRAFVGRLLDRAHAAGCRTLVLTLDLQVMATRYRDRRNGLSVPPRVTLSTVAGLLARPRWCLGMLRTPRRTFGNIVGHVDGPIDPASIAAWNARQFDDALSWSDVEWVRERWPGKLVLKGILDPEDARRGVSIGADALVVSNHGGRQLDGAPSTVAALERVVERVGADIELHADGGVETGLDVLRLLGLGARGVHVGRAALYGLGAGGQAGVERVLDLLAKDLDTAMALCGLEAVDRARRSAARRVDRQNPSVSRPGDVERRERCPVP